MKIRKVIPTLFLIILLMLILLSHNITLASPEVHTDVSVKIKEKYEIIELGGTIICDMLITITPANETPQELTLIFDKKYGDNIVYFKCCSNSKELDVSVITDENITKYIVNLEGKYDKISVIYVLKKAFTEEDSKTYLLNILYAPTISYPVASLEISIIVPKDLEIISFPGPFKAQENATLKRIFVLFTGNVANDKAGNELSIRLGSNQEHKVQLLTTAITRHIFVELDGSYLVRDYIKVLSYSNFTYNKGFEITCHIPHKANNIRAWSVVGQPLNISINEDTLKIPIPHSLNIGESASIIVEYTIPIIKIMNVNNMENVTLNSSMFLAVDYIVEKLTIYIHDCDGNIISQYSYSNITLFSDINISLPVRYSPFYSIIENSAIVYLPVLAGILLFGYRVISNFTLALKGLPREYKEELSKYITLISNLIKLEKDYLSRKVKAREYLRSKNKMLKETLNLEKRLLKIEEKIADKLKIGTQVVESRKQVSNTLNKIRKLENEYLSRKVDYENYQKRKRELIEELNTKIRHIETLI